MTLIHPTQHEKNEWSRFATEAYKLGLNQTGHTYSVAASLPHDGAMQCKPYPFRFTARPETPWVMAS